MAITSGFFDSVSGDRTYDAEQMSSYFDGLVSDGVFESVGDRLAVTPSTSSLAVNVATGRALIKCHWLKNDSVAVLNLDPADVQLNRIDAVCLRLDMTARQISLVIKKGTAVSGNPQIPAITREGSVYELYLAAVLINRGASTPSTVTDLRPSSYCGWITGLIHQVDTSDLFDQWQAAYSEQFAAFESYIAAKEAAFNEWFALLTSTLNVYTGLTKYQRRIRVNAGDTAAQIGLLPHEIGVEPEVKYDPDLDVLIAYANGKYLAQDKDYVVMQTLSVNPPYSIFLKGGKTWGDISGSADRVTVDFMILRNEIGKIVIQADDIKLSANGVKKSKVVSGGEFEEV